VREGCGGIRLNFFLAPFLLERRFKLRQRRGAAFRAIQPATKVLVEVCYLVWQLQRYRARAHLSSFFLSPVPYVGSEGIGIVVIFLFAGLGSSRIQGDTNSIAEHEQGVID